MSNLRVWRSLGTVTTVFLSGCFSYVPAEPEMVPEGQQVRVYLGREALVDLAELGELQGPFVTGTVMRRDADRFLLRVPTTTRRQGFMVESLGQNVVIRTDQVVQMERRQMNHLGTGLLAVGSTVAVGGLVFFIIDGARSGERSPVSDDVEARIPLISLPWR